MATEKQIAKEAIEVGRAAERKSLREKAEALRIKGLEKMNATLKRANGALLNAPQPVNYGIVAGTGAVGAIGGFKGQKALAKSTVEWVYTAEQVPQNPELIGKPTTTAVMVKDVLLPVIGLGLAVGGAFIKHPTASAVMMGGGTGLATGSIISSAIDPTP